MSKSASLGNKINNVSGLTALITSLNDYSGSNLFFVYNLSYLVTKDGIILVSFNILIIRFSYSDISSLCLVDYPVSDSMLFYIVVLLCLEFLRKFKLNTWESVKTSSPITFKEFITSCAFYNSAIFANFG